uniref:Uncharacterized protein n=1 Tax=Triticum aestivum TaxID=4565 RepID=A0A077S740_WHEAT|nr:unnamed protein product [Triticum aestivum]
MAASKGARKSLVSRTLERCRSGLNSGGKSSAAVAPGCFSVYVGPERERFVVRADRANHPLFRRLLDDAEQEYGYAAQGPLTLPCSVDAFLDVLWHMDHDVHDDDDGEVASAPTTPICGLQRGGSGNIKEVSSRRAEISTSDHPLFRRLLDDAEQEYGYAAQGPLTLPCSVDAFLDVLWHMDHDVHDDDDGEVASAPTTPICGLQRGGSGNIKVRPAGYRVLSPAKSTPASFFFSQTAAGGRW